jgi:hypothetical protein
MVGVVLLVFDAYHLSQLFLSFMLLVAVLLVAAACIRPAARTKQIVSSYHK